MSKAKKDRSITVAEYRMPDGERKIDVYIPPLKRFDVGVRFTLTDKQAVELKTVLGMTNHVRSFENGVMSKVFGWDK